MDRFRAGSPVYGRQRSNAANNSNSSNAGAGSGSSAMSPAHPAASAHNRSASATGFSNIKRTQNYAAKAAAARLAQVMASQTPDEEEDDDGPFRYASYGGAPSNASAVPSGASSFPSVPPPRSSAANRSNSPAFGRTFNEARSTSTGKPSVVVRQTPLVPPASRTQKPSVPSMEPIKPTERRPSTDLRRFNVRDDPIQQPASAGLRDEVDMLEEENDNLRNKLRLAEEKLEEADARAMELEKQVASLGEGISLEARLLSRKEAALRQREAALKAQAQTSTVKDDEIAALRLEADAAKDEAASIAQQLRDAESETKSLCLMTQRMILTQEQMEEVVLKRCWLARYWGLAVRHGIHPEIAGPKHEHWSSLAPLPFEVVISAGQKAKEDPENARIPPENGNDDAERKAKVIRDFNDLSGDGNIESMLLVEKGLHELASLKVEDAVVLAMAQHRRPSLVRVGQSFSDTKSIGDSSKIVEAFELSQEEIEDVQFKQAWLMYFWKRATTHGVEDDVAEDRLQYWIGRSNQAATSHDAVDVERGLLELRKLGIDDQLWEASRKIIEEEFINHRSTEDAEAAT